ncbi:MAG: MmgE/PrpD family protein [Burkholderiales bacterium]|nr:MmgE/PrpD family protein [Burkholderiales bacterium]
MTKRYTQELAQLVLGTRADAIPDDVYLTTQACLLDSIGVGLAGSVDELVSILESVVSDLGGAEQSSVIGRRRKFSMADAALLNGVIIHTFDFDDMHLASSMHPSAPVFGAAMAVAEHVGASGLEMLRASALGLEVCTRIGDAVNPAHYSGGWHATATLGHFGSVTAASVLLGLTPQQMVHALGIAGTQAAGLKAPFGTMTKPLHAGHAARNGVVAAMLASRGFTCTEEILEGKTAFGAVMSKNPDWEKVVGEWGQRWTTLDILYKPHATSFCTQALIESVIELRGQHGLTPDNVAKIRGFVSQMSFNNAVIGNPKTGLEAKFSHTFAAAQALAYGQATQHDYTDERVAEDVIQKIRAKTVVQAREDLRWPMAYVEIDTVDGKTLKNGVDLEERMKSAQQKWDLVSKKFVRIMKGVIADDQVNRLVQQVDQLQASKKFDASAYAIEVADK